MELINQYIDYLHIVKGKSTNTCNSYFGDLAGFVQYMNEAYPGNTIDQLCLRADLSDMFAYMKFLEEVRLNSPRTRARKVASIKGFYSFLFNKLKVIDINPAEELDSPKIPQREIVYLTLSEARNIFSQMDKKHVNYLRDYCILTLFLHCGLRVSELCNIQLCDLQDDKLLVHGKGDKERTVYLNETCLDAVYTYLNSDSRRDLDSAYLFLSLRKNPISPRCVQIMVKRVLEKAYYKNYYKITPHKLRHTAATLLYKQGVDLRKLQLLLGHVNLNTTQIYVHVDDDAMRAVSTSHPLNN